MCDAPWVQVCSIFPRISSNIFCYISKILQSNLQYVNSPLEILCADFWALHACSTSVGKNIKFSNRMQILPSKLEYVNSPLESKFPT